jgi:hypothetical protein
MKFSVTEATGNFQRCERMWRLTAKSGMHLGPIVSPVYLSTGTLIHKGSQQWLLDLGRPPEARKSFAEHVLEAGYTMLEKAQARYLAQVRVPMSSDETQLLTGAVYYARTMAENYEIRWGTPLPEHFTILRPEQRALVPIPGTEHNCELLDTGDAFGIGSTHRRLSSGSAQICTECDGMGVAVHYLDMRFDGLVVDRAGRIHILEHKTFKNHPSITSLRNNIQFLAYIWGARQLGLGQVVGLAYDGIWRRDKVPKGKTFEDLFMRYDHTRPEAELAEFGAQLPYLANEMYDKRPAARPLASLPISRRWQGCYDCRFDDDAKTGAPGVCSAMSRGETDLVNVLLKTKFTERTDDTEDDADED